MSSNLPVVPETPSDTDIDTEKQEKESGNAPEDEHVVPSNPPGEEKAEDEEAEGGTGGVPTEDDGYDTDIEVPERKRCFDRTGRRIYFDICEKLGLVPASYFLRNIEEQEVTMPHHGLGPLGAKAVAFPLITNTKIFTLNLSDNWLADDGACYLSQMLKENCYISKLNLSDNRIGSAGATAICEMLEQNITVTELNLSGNEFKDKDARRFAKALLETKSLAWLSLSHNKFGDGSGAPLGYAIGENETLEYLDLSWNHFRRKSGADIVDGVKVNTRLKVVDLSWNGLAKGAAASLSECFKQNSILRELDISSNRITAEDATVIAKGLPVNETLVVLKVGNNPLGPSGAMTLLRAIDNERSILETLDLTGLVVDKAFAAFCKDFQERRNVAVPYSGVFSNYVLKSKGKKRGGSSAKGDDQGTLEERMSALVLLVHANIQDNAKVEEVFYALDKNREHKMTPLDLKKALLQLNIPELTENLIDTNLQQAALDVDAKVNYRSSLLADGAAAVKVRDCRLPWQPKRRKPS